VLARIRLFPSRFLPLLSLAFTLPGLPSCASLAPTEDPAPVVRGPFPTRQQQPMALTFMAFRPRRAATQAEGTWAGGVQLAWSNIEEIRRYQEESPAESVSFDGETVRTTLRGRCGLTSSVDLELELPFLWAGAGGMDQFIAEFHELFDLPDGARDEFPDDQYEMRVESHGDTLYELEGNEIGLQDVPLFLTWNLVGERQGRPGLAVRAGVEFPTGSEERGFGNGAFDYGAGLVAEKSLGRWTIAGGFDWIFPGQPDRMREASGDHHIDPMLALHLSGECRWNDSLSVIAGTTWTSRMLHSVNLEEVNREVFDLGLGLAWDLGRAGRMAFSLHEDLVAATGSDLAAQLGWVWGY